LSYKKNQVPIDEYFQVQLIDYKELGKNKSPLPNFPFVKEGGLLPFLTGIGGFFASVP